MTSNLSEGVAVAVERLAGWMRGHLSVDSRWRPLLRRVRAQLPRTKPQARIAPAIELFAQAFPGARFVQIGSNDATQLDPLREKILTTQWRGVLIEPVPYVFERLRRQYAGVDRVVLENVAIADCDGHKDFYYLRQAEAGENLPAWYDALGSFRRDVILSHAHHIPDIERRLMCESVPCMTFDALCRRHRLDQIDLIHIDTEGYDFEIIKLIDLDRYRPTVLMFEHYHLGTAEQARCEAHMRAAGYELLPEAMDTICLRTRGPGAAPPELRRLWRRLRALPALWPPRHA